MGEHGRPNFPATKRPRYVRVGVCLYRQSDGRYYYKGQIAGCEMTRSLRTTDRALALRRLADFRRDRERLEAGADQVTLAALCESYRASILSRSLKPHTVSIKRRILDRITDWPTGKFTPISKIRPSDCDRFLARYSLGASSRNDHVWTLRDLFAFAIRDKLLISSPAEHLRASKRPDPVRLTPTFEDFKAIIASVRAVNGHRAGDSADFLEAQGLLGLGQAELSTLAVGNVDWHSSQISVMRHKTGKRFMIPIYGQARALLQKLCEGKAHDRRLFKLSDAKKALAGACRRLGLPP